jgi:hypothetical protein
MSCGRHPGSIIKHVSDLVPRCPFCGVSQGDWEAMETEMQWSTAVAPTPPQVPTRSWTYGAGAGPYPGNGNNSSNPLQYDRYELEKDYYRWLLEERKHYS